LRDGAAADALGQDDAFWKARARNHVKLNYYRLVYRSLIYGDATKGPLPLTPESTWDIRPIGRARRERIIGHDLVTRDYRFSSVIVTDVARPGGSSLTSRGWAASGTSRSFSPPIPSSCSSALATPALDWRGRRAGTLMCPVPVAPAGGRRARLGA
jgi:hypothetical protein